MNLLVTGGAGFIGSQFILQRIDRPEIRRLVNLDCLTYAAQPAFLDHLTGHPKYVFARIDLRDAPSVTRIFRDHSITHVLHLAAESHVDRSIDRPVDFVSTNVLGTLHLLEACRECWRGEYLQRRFHHVSTDEVFGSLGVEGSFTESSPYAPNSPYAASKAGADMLVRAFAHTYGLPVVLTNCSNNFGPHQYPEKLIPRALLRLFRREFIPVFGDGLQVRDWIYVNDHVDALWEVLLRGRTRESYNVGGRNEWPNLRLIERLCDLVDEQLPELGGRSRQLIRLVADRPGHDRRYALDPARIEQELGWRPQWTFEAALRETIEWYWNNRSLWKETI